MHISRWLQASYISPTNNYSATTHQKLFYPHERNKGILKYLRIKQPTFFPFDGYIEWLRSAAEISFQFETYRIVLIKNNLNLQSSVLSTN